MRLLGRINVVAVGLIAFIVASCGPPKEDDSGGSIPPDEVGNRFGEVVAKSFCDTVYKCSEKSASGQIGALSRFETHSNCVEKFPNRLGSGDLDAIQEDIDAGLTEYDGEAAAKCIQKFEDRLLSDVCITPVGSGQFDVCREVFTGTQEQGEPCTEDRHCVSANCDTEGGDPETCYGVCAEPREEPKKVGAGEACGGNTNQVCDPEKKLACESQGQQEGNVCVEWRSVDEGGSCTNTVVCKGKLVCTQETCSQAITTLQGEGETCDISDDSTVCEPGLICDLEAGGDSAGAKGTCAPPLGQGEECFASQECKWNLYCDGAMFQGTNPQPGTCEEKKSAGSDCQESNECEGRLSCTEGTCKEELGGGESCELPSQQNG